MSHNQQKKIELKQRLQVLLQLKPLQQGACMSENPPVAQTTDALFNLGQENRREAEAF